MKTGKSIITNNLNDCYVCGRPACQIHHCIFGSRRKLADEDGLTVPLCLDCHNEVHNGDGKLKRRLQIEAQEAYEELYGHDAYMTRYGKNYKN